MLLHFLHDNKHNQPMGWLLAIEVTGLPAVDDTTVTTLIRDNSRMTQPILKPFESIEVKTLIIFLVYDKH